MLMLGGQGTVIGPAIGAFLYEQLRGWLLTSEYLSHFQLVIAGALLLVIVLFAPGGLMGWLYSAGRGRGGGSNERAARGRRHEQALRRPAGRAALSFTVAEGKILGLIGPNGAGKSTVFNLINGVVAPDSGRVMFAGADITGGAALPRRAPRPRAHPPDRAAVQAH